jgi:hypothetical protein
MRLAFYISTPIVGFLALMFFATIGGETADMNAVATAVTMFGAFVFALQNLVRERKVGASPFAKLYFGVWIYSVFSLPAWR